MITLGIGPALVIGGIVFALLGVAGYLLFLGLLARAEAARQDGIRAVSVVTPNHLHAPVATAFLDAGIHVICDKPLAATPDQARAIADAAARSTARLFLTHNYCAHPMVREARAIVAEGGIGDLRLVQAEFLQGWLADDTSSKQADWRTDPGQAGAGAIGDIGTHAWQLAAFVTGQVPDRLSADLSSMVPGRRVDDDARIALRYASGAKGGLWCSQVAVGQEDQVGDTHQHTVDPASIEGSDRTNRGRNEDRYQCRDQAEKEGRAGAVEQLAEYVPPQRIGSEKVGIGPAQDRR